MKPRPIGLVGAGSLSRSFLARLPALHERLGPVLAPSQRLASRLVNVLRAGRAVERYEELEDSSVVLVAVPDSLLPQVVAGLAAGVSDWTGRTVLLCDTREDCLVLQDLAKRGAATASLTPLAGPKPRYIVEGDRRAVREARSLVHGSGAQVWEMPCGNKPFFFAALTFSSGVLPVADAAARCLRAAGLPAPACTSLNQELLDRTLRAYLHGGRKAWGGVVADGDAAQAARELAALEGADPSLARAYRQLARFALEWFERDGTWFERIAAPGSPHPLRGARKPRPSGQACATPYDSSQ